MSVTDKPLLRCIVLDGGSNEFTLLLEKTGSEFGENKSYFG